MPASGITVSDEIKSAFTNAFSNEKRKDGKAKFIIFKINDTMDDLLIDEISQDPDYEVFRNKLESARDSKGKPVPRYGVYDAEYELPGEGHRSELVFISWCPGSNLAWNFVHASTQQELKSALGCHKYFIFADTKSEIEWKAVLAVASNGKIK